MNDARLEPWMLLSDWREDRRPWLFVDLAEWPAAVPLSSLPQVPVIGVGRSDHPLAAQVDAVLEPGFSLAQLASRIEPAPLASAALVQLLRTTHAMEPSAALMVESMTYSMLQGGPEHASWQAAQRSMAQTGPGVLHLMRDGNRLDLLLDRPHAFNAIDRTLRDALFDAFTLAALDDSIGTIRLRATGRTFSVGADLAEFGTSRDPATAHSIRVRTLPAWPLLRRTCIFEAHVHGACVGSGLELVAFAARVTASTKAWFHLPETGMGILPGFGGTVSVTRRISDNGPPC